MFKHRTSIEFPSELWKELSGKVPNRKKGQFVLEAIKEKLAKESMKVLILCGGEGTQMRPLTFSIPKPMLPLGYKPILEHTITYCKQQGFYNFILSVSYLGEQIIKYFGNGSSLGVNIEYATEKENLGTAGAIKNSEKLINSTFLLIYGDIVFNDLVLKELTQFHREKKGIGTLLLSKVQDARKFGLVEMDSENKITSFTEKPKYATPGLVNAGLYVFEPEIFEFIPKRKNVFLESETFPKVVEKGKIFGFVHNGYWADIGVPGDYEKVAQDFLTRNRV